MKTAIFWAATLGVFGVSNAMIASKEAAIRNGETIYLELAPRDPRSLMQGDYMALDYKLENEAVGNANLAHTQGKPQRRGKLVVKINEDRTAGFVRIHRGEPLAAGERLVRYRRDRNGSIEVGTNAFFFQEGHADAYAGARFGEYKIAPSGEAILVALRNGDFSRAGPQTAASP
jgi:uncharacterized membrane-anchored protein